MPELKILNSKEIKEFLNLIEEQWGAKLKLDYGFLKKQSDKIYIVNKEIANINLEKLRINSIGLYFAELSRVGIRLSIEGSQIVGKSATKNVIEVTEEQMKKWLKGEDLEINAEAENFVILKHQNDFLGTGKYKDGKILNYVSKERRISAI